MCFATEISNQTRNSHRYQFNYGPTSELMAKEIKNLLVNAIHDRKLRELGAKYLKGALVYQKERDRFQCPAGKYLTPTPAIVENHKRYVASSADCRACAQASTCPAQRRGSSPKRFVLRNLDQDLFEEVQARMRDPTFRTKRTERMWKMEGLFAEAKQNHGLSRARYRGRTKVQIQAYLSAAVQNLKRLVA